MISGTTVTVLSQYVNGTDRFKNVVYGLTGAEVDDVLVSPASTELLEAERENGVSVSYTLHFPKTYTGSLEGCEIELPAPWGGRYKVIGNPQPYMDANTPTRWNRPVEVEAAHG